MATLMGKYKNDEWEAVDQTDPTSHVSEKDQMKAIEADYKDTFGSCWLWKWEIEIPAELVPA